MGLESWTFDGWVLTEGIVRGWEYRSGTDVAAAAVGSNAQVPNRSGELWRSKVLGPGQFSLNVWLAGASYQAARASYNTLLRAVQRPHRQIRVNRTLPDGEVIFADVELTGKIEPTHLGQLGYRASLDFNVPAGVWQSVTVYTAQTIAGAALPQSLSLVAFEPSTGPLERLTYTIKGRLASPVLVDRTDLVDGDSVSYVGTIAAGQSLILNSDTWGISGAGGMSPNLAAVNVSGERLLAVPAARPGLNPTVELRGSTPDLTTQLIVSGRRSYLI